MLSLAALFCKGKYWQQILLMYALSRMHMKSGLRTFRVQKTNNSFVFRSAKRKVIHKRSTETDSGTVRAAAAEPLNETEALRETVAALPDAATCCRTNYSEVVQT